MDELKQGVKSSLGWIELANYTADPTDVNTKRTGLCSVSGALKYYDGSSWYEVATLTENGTLFVDQDSNDIALKVDTEATTADGVYIDAQLMTSGEALKVIVDSDLLTGKAIQVLGSTDHATDVFSVDANGLISTAADSILIKGTQTPAAGGTGVAGEIAWDADYLYVCTANNTWKRVALTGSYT